MRALGLSLTLVGLCLLVYLYSFVVPGIEIEKATLKQVVALEGVVSSESVRGDYHFLTIGSTTVVCTCSHFYLGKRVRVKGYVDEYRNNREVRALRIIPLD